jgi:site-specific DNA-methyltransferase (adenine-specific)
MTVEIINGDCVEVMGRIEPGTASLVFADPPYNIGVKYDEHNDSMTSSDYLSWCSEWIRASVKILSPTGSMWVLINDEHAAQMATIMRASGLHPRSWVIWYETFGVNCTAKFNRTKRHLLYMVRNPNRFTFNRTAVSTKSARQLKYRDKRANPTGKILDDVWTIPRVAGTHKDRVKEFPTQLPLELMRRVVGCGSNPGELVVDPFSGSGTTGVMCQEAGRRYMGIELSARYAELSRKRLDVAARDITQMQLTPGKISHGSAVDD